MVRRCGQKGRTDRAPRSESLMNNTDLCAKMADKNTVFMITANSETVRSGTSFIVRQFL